MGGLYVVYVWLGQTPVNKNTTNLECVLYLCLKLDWRRSDVLLASTFTSGKALTFLSMQKMCAEVEADKKWLTFIRSSRQIINEFWCTPSESQRTDHCVCWTCVMVCVTGPIPTEPLCQIWKQSYQWYRKYPVYKLYEQLFWKFCVFGSKIKNLNKQ